MGTDTIFENTVVLAYIGDAAYELHVRAHVISSGLLHGDKLHLAATRYVRASAQAGVMKAVFDGLPDEEQRLVKRARNRRITTKPKNADPVEYKWATAFEALIGYYCLSGQEDRLKAMADRAMAIIDGIDPDVPAPGGG
jgi:ribonuclease-3 family protein